MYLACRFYHRPDGVQLRERAPILAATLRVTEVTLPARKPVVCVCDCVG